jgi:hypothetical protein
MSSTMLSNNCTRNATGQEYAGHVAYLQAAKAATLH